MGQRRLKCPSIIRPMLVGDALLRKAGIRTLTVAAQRWNFTSFPQYFILITAMRPLHVDDYVIRFVVAWRGCG